MPPINSNHKEDAHGSSRIMDRSLRSLCVAVGYKPQPVFRGHLSLYAHWASKVSYRSRAATLCTRQVQDIYFGITIFAAF
jgi:hypothetical protein